MSNPAPPPHSPIEEEEIGGRPSLLSSSVLTYGTLLVASALSLLNVFVVARSLGATGRGDVAFLTTMAFIITQAASIGVDQANVNFASEDPKRAPTLSTNSLLLALVLGTTAGIVMTAVFTLIPAVGGDAPTALRAMILLAVPLLIANFFLVHLVESAYGFVTLNAAYALPPFVNLAVNGGLALTGHLSVGLAVGTWILGQALAFLVIARFIRRRLEGFGRPSFALAKRQLGFGVKAQGGRLMMLGNYRLDQWILGSISGSYELGLYSVAVSWAEAAFFVPSALTAAQRPDLTRATTAEARRDAAAAFRIAMLLSLACVCGLLLLAPFLCTTIFGEEFAESTRYLRILALGAFGIAALKMLGSALTAQRRPLLETGAVGIAFIVIVGLDIWLIPAHGGLGASIASSVAYSLGGLAITIIFARALGGRVIDLVPRPSDATFFVGRLRQAVGQIRSRG